MTKPKPRKQRTRVGEGRGKEKPPKVLFQRLKRHGDEDDPLRPEEITPEKARELLSAEPGEVSLAVRQEAVIALANELKAGNFKLPGLQPDALRKILLSYQPKVFVLERDSEQYTFEPRPDEGVTKITFVGKRSRTEEVVDSPVARERWTRLTKDGWKPW